MTQSCRVVLLALLCACGTTNNRPVASERQATPDVPTAEEEAPEETTPASTPEAGPPVAVPIPAEVVVSDPVLTRVGGEDLHSTELLQRWLHRDPTMVRSFIEELILEKLVGHESERMGIVIPEDQLDAKTAEAVQIMEQGIAGGGSDLELDDFVRRRMALEPAAYRATLREEQRLDLLAERCVRGWLLTSDHARAQTLVVDDRALVDQLLVDLQTGGDFEALAREHSLASTEEEALRVHHLVRSPAPMSRLAFSTSVGQVGGPITQGGRFLILKVLSREKGLPGKWPEIRDAVVSSLQERGIEDPEYWQWKDSMLERYEVDMTPFFDVLPEAAGKSSSN